MYTKEWDQQHGRNGGWEILDPEGGFVCYVVCSDIAADALLSHLNRS